MGSLRAEQVPALPFTEPDQVGVWVAATESGTRYVLAVPPEGLPRAVRVAYYGYDRGVWRPLHSVRALKVENPAEPMQVGLPARVVFTPSEGDWYSSTRIQSIASYGADALLCLDQVVTEAEAALAEDLITLIVRAAESQRLGDSDVERLCWQTGADRQQVTARLAGDAGARAKPGDAFQ